MTRNCMEPRLYNNVQYYVILLLLIVTVKKIKLAILKVPVKFGYKNLNSNMSLWNKESCVLLQCYWRIFMCTGL